MRRKPIDFNSIIPGDVVLATTFTNPHQVWWWEVQCVDPHTLLARVRRVAKTRVTAVIDLRTVRNHRAAGSRQR